MYFDFNEKVNRIPSHRILAINRAEKENAIKLKIQTSEEKMNIKIENLEKQVENQNKLINKLGNKKVNVL